MKQKITQAVNQLKTWSEPGEKNILFEHHTSLQNKIVTVNLTLSTDRTINILLTDIKGYSPNYINKKAKSILKKALLPTPEINSILWVKDDGTDLNLGTVYTLDPGFRYHGIGELAFLDCSGDILHQTFKGEYLGKKPGSCKPGFGRDYKLYKIVS